MSRYFPVFLFLAVSTVATFAAPPTDSRLPMRAVVPDAPRPGPGGGSACSGGTVIHVNGVTGGDLSSCGTMESPCRSIQFAINLVPMVVTEDVTIQIAGGTYAGGILLAGRNSPNAARIILSGAPDETIISGPDSQRTGISIRSTSGAVIQNLTVEGFEDRGIEVLFSSDTVIRSSWIARNGDGVFLGESDSVISDSVVEGNLRHGISCEGGWVALSSSGPDPIGTTVMDNGRGGIRVDGCRARFEAPATLSGNGIGLLAVHGGVVDLGLRADIGLSAGDGQQPMMADCHGMVMNFVNSCAGACTCQEENYGVCQAGTSGPGSGDGHGPRFDRNQ